MKSLFANEEIILPSWLKILLETIDSETIQELSENQEYRKMQIRRKELLEHYPIIEKVIDDEERGKSAGERRYPYPDNFSIYCSSQPHHSPAQTHSRPA